MVTIIESARATIMEYNYGCRRMFAIENNLDLIWVIGSMGCPEEFLQQNKRLQLLDFTAVCRWRRQIKKHKYTYI